MGRWRRVVTVVCFVRVYRDECVLSAAGMVVVWRRRWSGGRAGGSLSVTGELMCHPEVVRADSTPAAL